jgi:hypothetical protein
VPLILAAIATTGTTITGLVSFSRHRREKGQATADENRRWSLEILPPVENGWHPASLKRRQDGGVPVLLFSIKVEKPRRSLLTVERQVALIGAVTWEELDRRSPDVSQSARRLLIEKDLSEEERFASAGSSSRVGLGYSVTRFFVSAPRPSRFTRWASSRRVTITVEAEEISSARRSIRTKVHSQPIDWMASNVKAAT